LRVVDEAQRLKRECIEYLRHVHDHPDTRYALLPSNASSRPASSSDAAQPCMKRSVRAFPRREG
jgi:hypothetical protein